MSLLIDALKRAGDAREIHQVTGMDSVPDVAPDDYLGQQKTPARVPPTAIPAVPRLDLELTPAPIPAPAPAPAPKESSAPTSKSSGLNLTLEEIKPVAHKASIDDRIPAFTPPPEPESTAAVAPVEVAPNIPVENPLPTPAPAQAAAAPAEIARNAEPEQPARATASAPAPTSRSKAAKTSANVAGSRRALPPIRVLVLGGAIALLGFIGIASYFYYQQQMDSLAIAPLPPLSPLPPPAETIESTAEPVATIEDAPRLVPPQPIARAPAPTARRLANDPAPAHITKPAEPIAKPLKELAVLAPPVIPTPAPIQANQAAQVTTATNSVPPAAESPPVVAATPKVEEPTPASQPAASTHQPAAVAELRENPVEVSLDNAYSFYRAGDWERAATAYRKVLSTDAQNRDALLGLAAIAARNGDLTQASDFYARLLMRDAKDAVALAGFVGVVGSLDPLRAQSELKSMLQQNPNAAFLRFALGNVYVAQQRWADAETEFFSAYRMEPTHPDYAYNLAISLDKLGERGSAVRYYQAALQNAKSTSARFDAAAVEQRIRAISNNAGQTGS